MQTTVPVQIGVKGRMSNWVNHGNDEGDCMAWEGCRSP